MEYSTLTSDAIVGIAIIMAFAIPYIANEIIKTIKYNREMKKRRQTK